MTLNQLEKAAGITDRETFWMPYAKIRGTITRNGKTRDAGLEAGIRELRRRAKLSGVVKNPNRR